MIFGDKYIAFNSNIENEIFDVPSLFHLTSSEHVHKQEKILKEREDEFNCFNINERINDSEDGISFDRIFFIKKNDEINEEKKYEEKEIFSKNKTEKIKKLRKKRILNEKVKDIIIKTHTAFDHDNILRKLQVHFISFIITYSNDVISFLVDDENIPYFQDVDYELKKVVNLKNVERLKKKEIGEIIQFKITPKIKKKEENENVKNLNLLLNKYPSLREFFKMNYLDLFKQYYNNENNIFKVNDKIIPLSPKTTKKTFSKLIEKNYNLKDKINYVCRNYLMNTYKKIKKPNFKTIILP
jgi:hypothetical protein